MAEPPECSSLLAIKSICSKMSRLQTFDDFHVFRIICVRCDGTIVTERTQSICCHIHKFPLWLIVNEYKIQFPFQFSNDNQIYSFNQQIWRHMNRGMANLITEWLFAATRPALQKYIIFTFFNFIIAIAPQSMICGRKYMKYVTETMTFIKIDAGKYECFRRPNDKTYADIVICFSFLISVLSVLLHWLISDKLRCVMLNRRGWDVNQFCSHNFSH